VKILLGIIFLVIAFVAYVRFLEATSIFYPARPIAYTPKALGLPFEDVYFQTADNLKLNGWLVKSPKDPHKDSTILFLHGNAGNIGDRLDKIQLFHKMGLNVFIVDYRGYGRSAGHPSEKGMYLDARGGWDYLRTRKDIDPNKIVGYGESLGGAAVIDLAAEQPVAALITDSAFSSAADMAKRIVPFVPAFLLSVKLDSVSKIKDVRGPKLIIHSPDDEVIPYAQARRLFEAAPEPKVFLEISGTHNEGYDVARSVYVLGIHEFLKKFNLVP
jgi:uncharacterized protein